MDGTIRQLGGLAAVVMFLATGCGRLDIRLHRSTVEEGKPIGVSAQLPDAAEGTPVNFQITRGAECGSLGSQTANINSAGIATVTYTGASGVEDCRVTLQASGNGRTGSTSFYVNKLPLTKVKIDGVSILVLFAIASFAIDRIVRGTLFGLSFFGFWRRLVPGPAEPGFAAGEKRQRLLYFILAATLAVLVLGWAGNVHMLGSPGIHAGQPAH